MSRTFVQVGVALTACALVILGNDFVLTILPRMFGLTSRSFIERRCCGFRYRLHVPEPRDRSQNQAFPLVVYLHGAGERGSDNRRQIMGLSWLGSGFNRQARAFRRDYPSFVYVPQCPVDKTWEDGEMVEMVVQGIAEIRDAYPIDTSRLYLIGYSMGGSGTYSVAARYNGANEQKIASIVRLAGQGLFDSDIHRRVSRSAVWLHVGLKDAPLRVERAREAFGLLEQWRNVSSTTSEPVRIEGHPGTTTILSEGDQKVALLTEYERDGHSIAGFPFDDPRLIEWLFEQRALRTRNDGDSSSGEQGTSDLPAKPREQNAEH